MSSHVIFCMEINRGHLSNVERMLQNPSFDPSEEDNKALRLAIRNNHYGIMYLLSKDQRVQKSLKINNTIF